MLDTKNPAKAGFSVFGCEPKGEQNSRKVFTFGIAAKTESDKSLYGNSMKSIELLKFLPSEIKKCINIDVPAEDRFSLSVALIDISLEHYYSISKLVEMKLYGSAAALIRPQMESYVVGLWLISEATDEEVLRFKSNKPLKSRTRRIKNKKANKHFSEYIDELKNVGDDMRETIKLNKKDVWSALNGYTHGGLIAVSRRFKEDYIKPDFSDELIDSLSHFTNQYAVFALTFIGNLPSGAPLREDIDKLIKLHVDAVSVPA